MLLLQKLRLWGEWRQIFGDCGPAFVAYYADGAMAAAGKPDQTQA